MLKIKLIYFLVLCFPCFYLHANKYEGILGGPVSEIKNMNNHARKFLPYNPIIVEIGAYNGAGTRGLSKNYPYGRIFAFEPHPKAYQLLEKNVDSLKNVSILNLAINDFTGTASLWGDSERASLIHGDEKSKIDVPCIVLDEWCKNSGIDHIDFLRLDAGGSEGQILNSSPKILNSALVIVTKTFLHPTKKSILSYYFLKKFLEDRGFTLLAHWYEDGKEGEAIFIRSYMYNAKYR